MAPAAVSFSVDPHFRQQIEVMPAPDEGCLALVTEPALRVLNNKSGTPRLQPRAPMSQQSECDVTGHVTSSYADGYRGPVMKHNGTITNRTFADCSAAIQESDVAKQVSACLVVDFAHYKGTPKVIARLAGASPQAAKNWLAGDNPPSLVSFLRLLPHSPSLRKLVAMESDLSPDFTRELSALIQRHIQR